MSMTRVKLVDSDELEEYPILCEERLDAHYFLQFNVARYDRSNFRKKAYRDPEVGYFGIELFYKSHGESPLGTLPVDPDDLAFLLGIPLERWNALMGRDFNPLYNWSRVLCDNGEVRLAHPVVLEVMVAALSSHKEHKASNEDKAVWTRRKRLREALKACACSDELISDEIAVGWLDEWLMKNHHGQRRMPQFQSSIGRALKAAAQEGVLNRSRVGR